MKKLVFIAMAALVMMTVACNNKSQKENTAEGEETTEQKAAWQTYTNDNYGYSIEVPGEMEKRETLTEDNGTIYSFDGDADFTFNRIDITGGKQIFDEEYTPEKVKEEFDYWTENKEITDVEVGDNYFTYTTLGDDLTQIDHHVYNGNRYVLVTICYDAEHEKDLSGEVADHVFKSIKFK